jgi:hypothetical protein
MSIQLKFAFLSLLASVALSLSPAAFAQHHADMVLIDEKPVIVDAATAAFERSLRGAVVLDVKPVISNVPVLQGAT